MDGILKIEHIKKEKEKGDFFAWIACFSCISSGAPWLPNVDQGQVLFYDHFLGLDGPQIVSEYQVLTCSSQEDRGRDKGAGRELWDDPTVVWATESQ